MNRHCRFAIACCLALCFAPVGALAEPSEKAPAQVEVINLPEIQDVYVTNTPAVQDVAVTNAPAVQDVAVISLPPGPECPAEPQRYQLVGFSDTTATGSAGVLGMTIICSDAFEGARMCNSVEVMETSDVPLLPESTEAWVRPIFAPIVGSVSDASGVTAANTLPAYLSCNSWKTDSHRGLQVNGRGGFLQGVCDASHPIACCALR
jgi:hypothetical protein